MRTSELWQLIDDEFGAAYGRHLAVSQVLPALADRTLVEAIEAGVPPRTAWLALCRMMDVPEDRWWGRDPKPRRRS